MARRNSDVEKSEEAHGRCCATPWQAEGCPTFGRRRQRVGRMKPLKTEVAFATPRFELVAKTIETGEPPYCWLRLPDWAAIVAVTAEGRVLAVRQHRPAVERRTIENERAANRPKNVRDR